MIKATENLGDNTIRTDAGEIAIPDDVTEIGIPPTTDERLAELHLRKMGKEADRVTGSDAVKLLLGKGGFNLTQLVRDGLLPEEQALDLSDAIAAYQRAKESTEASQRPRIYETTRRVLRKRSARARTLGDRLVAQTLGIDMSSDETTTPVALRRALREYSIEEPPSVDSASVVRREPDFRELQLPPSDRD